jgi:hypothetical protein
VFFDYQPHRNKDGPDMILKDFKGHLQTDGYETYSHFDEMEGILHANCMSHGRRKFEECLPNDVGRAEYVLQQMALLYNIERKAKDWSADDRLDIRQREAVPILDSLGAWMKDQYGQVTPKSAIGQALAYCIKRWKKLCVYTTDGNINIDNNPVYPNFWITRWRDPSAQSPSVARTSCYVVVMMPPGGQPRYTP